MIKFSIRNSLEVCFISHVRVLTKKRNFAILHLLKSFAFFKRFEWVKNFMDESNSREMRKET